MRVAVPETKQELLELIDAAIGGSEVILAPESQTPVKLVPIEEKRFVSGILGGIVPPGGPDFLEPMSEEELRDWEGA